MPARAKPPERRQRRRDPGEGDARRITALPSLHEPPPDPPASLGKQAAAEWDAFWSAPVAGAVDRASDLPALARLFELREERGRILRGLRRRTWVVGSQGQPKLSPLASYLVQLEGSILALEREFGLTPSSRLRLGLSAYDAARALEEMNALAEEGADDTPFMEGEEARE